MYIHKCLSLPSCNCFGQLNLVDGKMQYLFDENGRRYLDAFGGIATVSCGHCHPDVVEAIVNQTKKIQHSTVLYLNHSIADFAEALASKFPGDLKVCLVKNFVGVVRVELAVCVGCGPYFEKSMRALNLTSLIFSKLPVPNFQGFGKIPYSS